MKQLTDSKLLYDNIEKFLKECGYNILSTRQIAEGTQSIIILITAENKNEAEKFILKSFKDSYLSNTKEAIMKEFNSMCSFNNCIMASGFNYISIPKPILLPKEHNSYLMEYKDGNKLKNSLPKSINNRIKIMEKIIIGIDLFHSSQKHIYGDFHIDNLLINKHGSIIFLDVTSPVAFYSNDNFLALPYSYQAMDIGYFTFSSCVNFHKFLLKNPLEAFRILKFSKELTLFSADFFAKNNKLTYLNSLKYVCYAHLERLALSSRRGYIISISSNLLLRYIFSNSNSQVR